MGDQLDTVGDSTHQHEGTLLYKQSHAMHAVFDIGVTTNSALFW